MGKGARNAKGSASGMHPDRSKILSCYSSNPTVCTGIRLRKCPGGCRARYCDAHRALNIRNGCGCCKSEDAALRRESRTS